jgi:hypothetical protein
MDLRQMRDWVAAARAAATAIGMEAAGKQGGLEQLSASMARQWPPPGRRRRVNPGWDYWAGPE